MRFQIIDDGSDFDRYCDQLDQDEADKREAAIMQAVSEAVAESEMES